MRHRRASIATREQVVNLDHAVRELAAVRREMAELPDQLTKHEREVRLLEPMSRVALVVRFLDEILRRNGWERAPA